MDRDDGGVLMIFVVIIGLVAIAGLAYINSHQLEHDSATTSSGQTVITSSPTFMEGLTSLTCSMSAVISSPANLATYAVNADIPFKAYVQNSCLLGSFGTRATYFWNFGDGSYSYGQEISHRFASAGVKNITLSVSADLYSRVSCGGPEVGELGGPGVGRGEKDCIKLLRHYTLEEDVKVIITEGPVPTVTPTPTPTSTPPVTPTSTPTVTPTIPPIPFDSGTINVAANINAPFSLKKNLFVFYSGTTPWSNSNAPTGIYVIEWGAVSGYQTPLSQTLTLQKNSTVNFNGIYNAGTTPGTTVPPVTPPIVYDTDGDNVADPYDHCPYLFGSIINDGCPENYTGTDAGYKPPDVVVIISKTYERGFLEENWEYLILGFLFLLLVGVLIWLVTGDDKKRGRPTRARRSSPGIKITNIGRS